MTPGSGFTIPQRLELSCRSTPERTAWLLKLPGIIDEFATKWSLVAGAPFHDATCSWVAPAIRRDGVRVVLKIGMPHMEAEDEIAGLRFWGGDPAVLLLEADDSAGAMVLEWCEPGTSLRSEALVEQDRIIAQLLRRLWRVPEPPHPFRQLSVMTAFWCEETRRAAARWPDPGLVEEGIAVFEQLARAPTDDVLLATDLHAANVLSARREPWLVIDPKPFVGDAAYDATQHLFNRGIRFDPDPVRTIAHFAGMLDLDPARIGLWTFARAAAEPRDIWDEESMTLARALSRRLG